MGEELKLDAEPIDYGHDRTLIQQNLKVTPEERIRRQAAWGRGVRELQRAFGRA
jgi:hypothetical protein